MTIEVKCDENGCANFMSTENNYAFPSGYYNKGMELRDWFAGMALQGLLANALAWEQKTTGQTIELSYKMADLMLEERKK